MIYDNDNIGGNARDILEGGKEIELAKPERFLNSPDKNGKYFVLKRESADKPLQYMLYKEPYNKSYDPLLVRIQQNTGLYTFNEAAVPKEKTAINEDTLLGYAHLPPSYNNAHYDVSLFFGDNSFLNKQCEAYVERYYIPLSITLYKLLKEDNINPAFTIEEQFNTPHIFRAANESVRIGLRENYTKFFYNNEYYYLSEYTARQYKINMLEWKKFFRVIEKKADTIDDIIDGLGFIKKNYQWGTDSRNVGAALGDSNPDWHQEKNEIPKTRSIKRSIICGHPLELDKELYIENGKVKQKIKRSYGTGDFQNELDYFKNKVEAVDIWGGLKGKKIDGLDTNKNSFWFAHPVYFIKNVYEAGLLDTTFNPYYEEEIHIPIGGMHLESRAQKVIDSPGFAPVTSVATGYKGGKTHYSICTSLFNVSRQLKNRIMRHEGVDLAPYKNEKTEIKSLIYGKVWACTYSGTIQEKADSGYGRVMIIKALHEKKLYVLAHLDRYLKEVDDIVYPGDTVAKCGQTGNSTGVHLHVEVRLCEETEKKDVLSEEGNQKHKNDDSKSNGNGLAWAKEGNISKEPPRVNPFNHDENYKVT
jgi:murein DD-endopeptidase MepM/ murein hydrolase activator NlpD